jgi:fermentation-respiration switch protein FrsA (DUF1100 family)
MNMTEPFGVIRNARGERLDYIVHHPPGGSVASGPLAIIGHGVTSNKDRPWLIALGEAVAKAGIPALRFSFAGNGDSEGRYEDATLSKEVEDLGSVLHAVTTAGFAPLAYIGHSMGGAIGVLRAARDSRIRYLVSLAGMVHVQAFMQQQFGHLEAGRGLMLDKPGCIWNRPLEEDAARIGSLTAQAARIAVPWLLVHGDADELVPFADSQDAIRAAAHAPRLVNLPDVDHRFTGAEAQMIEAVVPWLREQML